MAVGTVFSVFAALRSRLSEAELGRRLAERSGCFGCHGAGGRHGAKNDGRVDGSVPNFADDVMMYAKSPEEIREWIVDGVTRRKAGSETWKAERDRGALRMPAYGDRFRKREIACLVAYVMAVAGMPEPDDSLAMAGLRRANALGCTGCHGPGGRLARPNSGSWKGYIPSWDGRDFAELVRDSTEFREWVQRGESRRFAANPFARFFLRRAAVVMPAFERHLEPGDLPALWAYIRWLRSAPREPLGLPAVGDRAR